MRYDSGLSEVRYEFTKSLRGRGALWSHRRNVSFDRLSVGSVGEHWLKRLPFVLTPVFVIDVGQKPSSREHLFRGPDRGVRG